MSKSHRVNECVVCGKERCTEIYCFRMGVTIYTSKNGQSWWSGKNIGRLADGVERKERLGAVAPKQASFDWLSESWIPESGV